MKLRAKDGVKGVGIGGREFVCDEHGLIELPDEFVAAALEHGFEHVPAHAHRAKKSVAAE